MKKNINNYLSLVKFSHTIFALPFALIGVFSAATISEGELSLRLFILILLCMIFARNAAMGFNRYADRKIDAINPRTASREIPAGIITSNNAAIFIILNVAAFIITTFFINLLCFYLSPVAIAIILFYSLSKRFTYLCHVVLGVSLSIAPIGASVAILGEFTLFPFLIGTAVLFWVSGFDILYALQDEEFDKTNKLNSIPSIFGIKKALIFSALLHLCSIMTIFIAGVIFEMNTIYFIGASIFAIIITWEHFVVTVKNISRVNLAFATMNGLASIIFAIFTIISFYF